MKKFKKVLTNERVCGILFELSKRGNEIRTANWTLKIKQRDKKRNPRFDGKRTIKKSFKKYFSNSNTEAKIAKYKSEVSNDEMSNKALKMIKTS